MSRVPAPRLTIAVVILLTAAVISVGSSSLATPSQGEINRTEMVRGVHARGGDVSLRDGEQTLTYSVTYGPGATSGWHRHPGAVVVIVKSGTMTTYGLSGELCTGEDVPAGAAYFEPDAARARYAHFVRNRGDVPFEAVVVAFNIPPGSSPLVDADAPPQCPDPTG
jgi:hypothetical protein